MTTWQFFPPRHVDNRGGSSLSRWGDVLKKIVPSGWRCNIFWGISCEKSILGGRAPCVPPPASAPG